MAPRTRGGQSSDQQQQLTAEQVRQYMMVMGPCEYPCICVDVDDDRRVMKRKSIKLRAFSANIDLFAEAVSVPFVEHHLTRKSEARVNVITVETVEWEAAEPEDDIECEHGEEARRTENHFLDEHFDELYPDSEGRDRLYYVRFEDVARVYRKWQRRCRMTLLMGLHPRADRRASAVARLTEQPLFERFVLKDVFDAAFPRVQGISDLYDL